MRGCEERELKARLYIWKPSERPAPGPPRQPWRAHPRYSGAAPGTEAEAAGRARKGRREERW